MINENEKSLLRRKVLKYLTSQNEKPIVQQSVIVITAFKGTMKINFPNCSEVHVSTFDMFGIRMIKQMIDFERVHYHKGCRRVDK